MLAGHFGAAFILHGMYAGDIPLAALFTLANVQDIIIGITAFGLKIDKVVSADEPPSAYWKHTKLVDIKYSHSLFTTLLVAVLVGPLASRAGLIDKKHSKYYSLAVLSHWFLDFVAHYPPSLDVCWPAYGGCPRVSLGLWRNLDASIAVESALVALGITVYVASQVSRSTSFTKASFPIFLTAGLGGILVMSVFSLPFTPPPPEISWQLAFANTVLYGIAAGIAWALTTAWRCVELKDAENDPIKTD